jgi:hypothetical protein
VDGEEHRPRAPPPWPRQGAAGDCVSPGAAVVVEALLGEGLARPVAGFGGVLGLLGVAGFLGVLAGAPRFTVSVGRGICRPRASAHASWTALLPGAVAVRGVPPVP